jgi:hypothetical protein
MHGSYRAVRSVLHGTFQTFNICLHRALHFSTHFSTLHLLVVVGTQTLTGNKQHHGTIVNNEKNNSQVSRT